MKKFVAILVVFIFAAGLMFFTGCGGGSKGQQISGAADENQQINEESKEVQKEELPTTYEVKAGDKLWSISQKPEIYGTKWQWPLIYDANRDILSSYKDLKEGQKLIIPRNVSAVEIEAAKERAMELGIPPKEKNEGEVAGLEKKEEQGKGSVKVASKTGNKTTGAEENTMEEQPTPIPEPSKGAPKKGGSNNMMLIVLAVVAVGAGITIFLAMQRKKDEEEEDTQKS